MKTAKFRGVPFEVEQGDDEPGSARNIIHEFPGRDDVEAESSGRFPRRFSLDAHLIGAGFEARLADLEIVLAQEGSGILEHPTRGKLTVVVVDVGHVRYSTHELGMARVQLVFCEVGPHKAPNLSVDTGLSLLASSKSVLDGMRLQRLDLSGFDFVRKAANAALSGPRSVTYALRQINARLTSTIGIVDDFSQAIDDFTHEVGALLDTPNELAIKLQGLMNSVLRCIALVAPITTAGDRQAPQARVGFALQNLSVLGTLGDQQGEVTGTSASRDRQRTNQEEINDLVEGSALAETCALFVDVELGSVSQANEVFDATGAIFDRLLERGTLEDDVAQRLRTLRSDFYAHLRRVSIDLSDLDTYVPTATLPAVLLAWNLYGDATRAEEIVIRNAVEHPGFVPGGVELAVSGA